MSLTGIDPLDPTPATRRELIFGAGRGSSGTSRDVMLYGNKTASGTESTDTIGPALADDQDARNRLGLRSELYRMYRSYIAVDQAANIKCLVIPESAGSAASCKLIILGTSDATSTIEVDMLGETVSYTVAVGDTATITSSGLADVLTNYDEGRLPVTVASAVEGAGFAVTVTAANLGPRGDFIIGNNAKRGVRVRIKTSSGTNAQTVEKITFVAGTTPDDASLAITAAASDENYYHVAPFHTDNGAGATATYAAGDSANITFGDADPDTIVRDGTADWAVDDGFAVGMSITVSGSVSNDGTYLIAAVTTTTLTLDSIEQLTVEVLAAGTLVASGAYGLGGTTTVSTSDNQIGELLDMIKTQALPANGKQQVAVFAHVGTNAQALAVPTDADANTVRGYWWWAENNDWTPGMLAAHHCAVMRSQHISHPSENLTGYSSSDATLYGVQSPFDVNDRPTATEVRTALNNGLSVVGVTAKGRAYIQRHITSRSENSTGEKDYRAREGHITSAIDFAWEHIRTLWESQKQPFVADDIGQGEVPYLRTTTPSNVQAIIFEGIDDLTAQKPLGRYDGPILAPDQADYMKSTVVATKIPAGIAVEADLIAVQHLLKFEGKFRETGEAY